MAQSCLHIVINLLQPPKPDQNTLHLSSSPASTEFREIQWKCRNSLETGKFRSSAQNSTENCGPYVLCSVLCTSYVHFVLCIILPMSTMYFTLCVLCVLTYRTSSLLILASSSGPGVPVNCIVFFNWLMSGDHKELMNNTDRQTDWQTSF